MILLNGQPQQSLPSTDRALHYGDGLFETIAVRNGRPQLWERHLQRLARGCERLGIEMPDARLLAAEAALLCNGTQRAVIKLVITRGSGGRGYRPPRESQPNRLLFRHPWPQHALADEAVTLRLCRTPLGRNPSLAGIKHLNRLEQVLARSEWDDEAIAEGLMCDCEGNLIEGTMSNLFCVRDGVLLTPDLSQCGVEGVMREYVLQLADELQIGYELVTLPVEELATMSELFITNSIIGVRAVAACEGVRYGDNPLTRRLQNALRDAVEAGHA